MGTRGVFGFRKGGIDKIAYNHYDSYLTGLGKDIVKFIKRNPIPILNDMFDKIILINDDIKFSEEKKKFADDKNVIMYEKGLIYMLDGSEFTEDGLCCEWGYIMNLDTNMLEIHKGRFPEGRGYRYKLIKEIPLNEVNESHIDDLIIEVGA